MVNAVDSLNLDAKRLWCVAHRLHLAVTNAFGFWIKKKEDTNNTKGDDDEEGTPLYTQSSTSQSRGTDRRMDRIEPDKEGVSGTVAD